MGTLSEYLENPKTKHMKSRLINLRTEDAELQTSHDHTSMCLGLGLLNVLSCPLSQTSLEHVWEQCNKRSVSKALQ